VGDGDGDEQHIDAMKLLRGGGHLLHELAAHFFLHFGIRWRISLLRGGNLRGLLVLLDRGSTTSI
jgi:hypothetical protein